MRAETRFALAKLIGLVSQSETPAHWGRVDGRRNQVEALRKSVNQLSNELAETRLILAQVLEHLVEDDA